ncbi:MAG: ABC transporter ATP-binding protein [Gemmatimonadota bacterium]|nr:MAG: ABC transporter ATP-binding protein [Gemmatimonadota bacterium]
MTVVRGEGVTRRFGSGRNEKVALLPCSIGIQRGEIVGLVGPNGAGKTTLLRLIAGELTLSEGELLIDGNHAGTRRARRVVGYAPDPPMAPVELTGVEWLKYLASHRASHPGERVAQLQWAVELADLEAFVGRRIGEYSRGMMQRLGLASAALCGNSVLALDEVLSGVDPLVSRKLRGQIVQLAALGRAVVVASHDLAALERIATRVLVIFDGRLSADVAVARLVEERVAELSLSGSGFVGIDRLLERFSGSVRTGEGVAVPLTDGLTVEKVLTTCRSLRIAVAASRTRYRALEDILVDAASTGERSER